MISESRRQDSWAELAMGGGVSARAMLAAPFGMRAAQSLQVGETLRTANGGPVSIVSICPAPQQGWIRIPPLAMGNRSEVVVGQGQGVLIESSFARQIVGSAAVVVPALALRHWRGIATCVAPTEGLRLTLSRPALLVGSTGVLLAANGPANHQAAAGLMTQGALPPVPNLSLASAQQLVACLIAYEAGAMLRGTRPYAAALAAPKRP